LTDLAGRDSLVANPPAGAAAAVCRENRQNRKKNMQISLVCVRRGLGKGGFWLAQSEFYFVVRRDICIAYARAPGSQNPQNPQYPQFSAAAVSMVTLAT